MDWDEPLKGDLVKLRIKDLQHFLTRKKINIKACIQKKATVDVIEDIKESVEVIQESNVHHEETSGAGDIEEFNQVISKIDKETFSDLNDRIEEECAEVIESGEEICLDLKVVHLEVD